MTYFLKRSGFDRLLSVLEEQDYTCVGPQVKDGAIVFGTLSDPSQLPAGWKDKQSPGSYALQQSDLPYWFDWANGPSAVKPFTFVPEETLWQVTRDDEGHLGFKATPPKVNKMAILGVRACDLAALAIQDQHFIQGEFCDPGYQARRESLLLIGVNCTHAAATCFCVSTGDGPEIKSGYDLLLSEIEDGFIVESDSEPGQHIIQQLNLVEATQNQQEKAKQRMQQASKQQRKLSKKPNLYEKLEQSAWEEVGSRCLACGNCTSVCPTCFCNQQVEQPSLDGNSSKHQRLWDSCYNPDHSRLHGGSVRQTHAEYYRQWLTHKLSGWHEQFGRSGCTGCGRCITWCPVGIDLTEEVSKLEGA